MENKITKQNFSKFFGQAMEYKDFWKAQCEWEERFEQDYQNYCQKFTRSKENEEEEVEKAIEDRPGICWEMPHSVVIGDLIDWMKRKPISKS